MTRRQSNRLAMVYTAVSMGFRMSSTFQAVVRGPSFLKLQLRQAANSAGSCEEISLTSSPWRRASSRSRS